ncbi:MAG TPA: DUF6249 domain-containing protein [Opitutaceae bacterium]|nr:DUF6249 domain-containing protein [Opitutaceae bacterium]
MSQILQPLPLAAAFGLGAPELIVVGICLSFPVFVVAIVAVALSFKHRQRQMWHETARLALEKGQPLPPLPQGERPSGLPSGEAMAYHDIRGGLVLFALGAGLWVMLMHTDTQYYFVGAIPGFIGIALLVFGVGRALVMRSASKTDRAGQTPPQT